MSIAEPQQGQECIQMFSITMAIIYTIFKKMFAHELWKYVICVS